MKLPAALQLLPCLLALILGCGTPILSAPAAASAVPTPLVQKYPAHLPSLTVNESRAIYLMDDTTGGEITDAVATTFISRLNELDAASPTEEVQIVINSVGGSVDAGSRMIAAMEATTAPITCIVDTGAFSMAAMLLEHCDQRVMQSYSAIMFHEMSIGIQGQDFQVKNRLHVAQAQWIAVQKDVAARLGLDLADFQSHCREEWWLSADEALESKAIDSTVTGLKYKAPAASEESSPILQFLFGR